MSGEWKFTFEAEAGHRILKRFIGVTSYGLDLWWSHPQRRWVTADELSNRAPDDWSAYPLGTTAPCRSFRAFKRHLRDKCASIPLGYEVTLVNHYIGYNVKAVRT